MTSKVERILRSREVNDVAEEGRPRGKLHVEEQEACSHRRRKAWRISLYNSRHSRFWWPWLELAESQLERIDSQ